MLLEQECQKLREELEGHQVFFEKETRSLKKELQLLQEKKISLEVHVASYPGLPRTRENKREGLGTRLRYMYTLYINGKFVDYL